MAALRPGNVSGYQPAGRDVRADAGKPGARKTGGTAAVAGRHPSVPVQPLKSPGKPVRIGAELRALARHIQRAQFGFRLLPPSSGGAAGSNPPAPPGPGGQGARGGGNALPPGPGMPYNRSWQYSASPAYGGAAYNNGGGGLANTMSGASTAPAAIPGGPRKALPAPSSPGVRVTGKPPASMRQSMAGRDRRAANFRRSHGGPVIIQGTAEPPDET